MSFKYWKKNIMNRDKQQSQKTVNKMMEIEIIESMSRNLKKVVQLR
jgi:hypothetical protein